MHNLPYLHKFLLRFHFKILQLNSDFQNTAETVFFLQLLSIINGLRTWYFLKLEPFLFFKYIQLAKSLSLATSHKKCVSLCRLCASSPLIFAGFFTTQLSKAGQSRGEDSPDTDKCVEYGPVTQSKTILLFNFFLRKLFCPSPSFIHHTSTHSM